MSGRLTNPWITSRWASGLISGIPPAERIWQPKLGQPTRQATVRERAVLRPIVAIVALGPAGHRVVARRKLRASRRGRRIIFSAGAGPQFVLAGGGCLQQGEAKFPIGGGRLLSHSRPRRTQ